jgi:phenylalanyl-tRNA synthetase alpha chain
MEAMTATTEAAALDALAKIVPEGTATIAAAPDAAALAAIESTLLGKSSVLSELKSSLGGMEPASRKTVGRAINEAKTALESLMGERRSALLAAARAEQLAAESIDLAEVVGSTPVGHHHLISRTREMLEDAFIGLGFTIAEGPEVETDWFNFEALNMPVGHPARSMWDTLYLEAGEPETILLRTHTSPVQIRTMMNHEPPIYIVAPGRTFRSDTADATHLPVFHQIEGLVIDRGITFADLAGTIEAFVKVLYGSDRTTRVRPSFFPFTEPSAEFDMSTPQGDWIELGGCGMVHPNVLKACGLDPEEWSGFAFGFGLERMASQRYGLDDIRELVTNDARFLAQF